MTLFDPDEGARLRDEAIARVEEHVVRREQGSTAGNPEDRLVLWQELLTAPAWTHEPRAMGAAMRRAERAGWCKPTDDWWLSKRPVCHRNPKRVWRSLCSEAA